MKRTVAILCSRFPYPLLKGDMLRVFQQMKVLSNHFDVHLICVSEDQPTKKDMEQVQAHCAQMSTYILPALTRHVNLICHCLSQMPLQVRYFFDRPIKQLIQQELRALEPDYIHIHRVRMFPYVADLNMDVPMSIDFMDSMVLNDLAGHYLNHGLRSLWKNRERKLIMAFEQKALAHFDAHFAISERDRYYLQLKEDPRIELLPLGVDMNYFKSSSTREEVFDLIFCGNLSYEPNRLAALFLIEKIHHSMTDKTMLIAGANPGEDLLSKARDGLEIRANVPDIRSVYQSGKVMLIPIFSGSGQQSKMLEAMACGVPCIVTSFVNEGIGAKPGEEVLIADDADSFILQANILLSQPEKRLAQGQAGRKFVEQHFNWKVNTSILVDTIKAAIDE